MNSSDHITTSMLQNYCLGLLSEEDMLRVDDACKANEQLRRELEQIELKMQDYSASFSLQPPPVLEETIWQTLEQVSKEQRGDLADLPLISKYSDHNNWKQMVMPLIPSEITREFSANVLRNKDGITQMLVISRCDVPEEIHVQERESLLVLEGECECHIGDNVIRLGPGGFLDIPLHVAHNVKALTPYVIAIVQHIAV